MWSISSTTYGAGQLKKRAWRMYGPIIHKTRAVQPLFITHQFKHSLLPTLARDNSLPAAHCINLVLWAVMVEDGHLSEIYQRLESVEKHCTRSYSVTWEAVAKCRNQIMKYWLKHHWSKYVKLNYAFWPWKSCRACFHKLILVLVQSLRIIGHLKW